MLRRIIAAAIVCLIASSACALDAGQRTILFGGAPGWVKRGAIVDLDFTNGRYFPSLGSVLRSSRTSVATDLIPTSASGYAYHTYAAGVLVLSPNIGLLAFNASTNLLLNSTAPATQTTGSLATGAYTLWVNGAGSATMSSGTGTGCGTSAATQGSIVNFTITVAGTCTVTVSGSLNAFQLESGSIGGTSFIVTTGTTATRAFDQIFTAGQLLSTMQGAQGTASVSGKTAALTGQATLIGSGITETWGMTATSLSGANGGSFLAAIGNLCVTSGQFAANTLGKMTGTWKQSSYGVSLNGAATVTSVASTTLLFGNAYSLGSLGGVASFNGVITRATFWRYQIANSLLPAL